MMDDPQVNSFIISRVLCEKGDPSDRHEGNGVRIGGRWLTSGRRDGEEVDS
jgi:hypothetical protein